MDDVSIIDITPQNIAGYGVCGYKDIRKHEELRRKIAWYTENYPKGFRIKALISQKDGYQGMIEYMPGEYAHRPVDADNYLFIQCIFTGFLKEYKHKGYGRALIRECIQDAEQQGRKGVAVVTRKGSFMAGKDIFLKLGFVVCDTAKPDFELLALLFEKNAEMPKFKADLGIRAGAYREGLYILRSRQCPYSWKNVNAIVKTARDTFHLDPKLIELESAGDVLNAPCAFGSFCIIYNGAVISHHPISKGRFTTIMKNLFKE